MGVEAVGRNTIEYEARRMAAAFEVDEWNLLASHSVDDEKGITKNEAWCELYANINGLQVRWNHNGNGKTNSLEIGAEKTDSCYVQLSNERNWCWASAIEQHNQFMARGLYRLGFSDQSILDQLPPLSAHEQMEARLSMPREFWPQMWLDEAEKDAS